MGTFRASILTLIIPLLVPYPVQGQTELLRTDGYVLSHWATREGLPSNDTRCMVQTRDGYLWIGTGAGLARFDGVRFVTFNNRNTPEIKASEVHALHEDRQGRLWIGYFGGGVLTYEKGRFSIPPACTLLTGANVQSIFSDSTGGVYICVASGVFLVAGNTGAFVEGLRGNPAQGFTGAGGEVYFMDSRLLRIRQGQLPELLYSVRENEGEIRAFAGDSSTLLALTREEIQPILLGRKGKISFAPPVKLRRPQTVVSDGYGNLLVGTASDGLYRFAGGKLSVPPGIETMGSAARKIRQLIRDRDGGIWAATGGGVYLARKSFSRVIGPERGWGDEFVWNLHYSRDGTLWIGRGPDGLDRVKNGVHRRFLRRDGLSDDHCTEIFESSDGTMWFGGLDGGIVVWKDGRFRRVDGFPGYVGGRVLSIAEDARGRIWVGTRLTLQVFDGKRFVLSPDEEYSPIRNVRCILPQPNGDLWYVSNGRVRRLRGERVTAFWERNERQLYSALALWVDSAHAWYGTYGGGLYLIRGDSVQSMRSVFPFFGPRVLGVHKDRRGYLWVNAERELQRVNERELLDAAGTPGARVHVDIYDYRDGFLDVEFNNSSLSSSQLLSDGRILYASTGGVVVIDPAAADRPTTPPPVQIESILADGVAVMPHDDAELPSGTRRLEIRFTAPHFAVPDRVRFRVRLSGVDRDWVEVEGLTRSVTYTNPGHGTFHFEAAASLNGGPWGEGAALSTFVIPPYLYQRWQFWLLAGMALVAILVVGYRHRVRAVTRRNRLLEAEITQRRNAEEQLTASLQEKTVMLKEIHHRVKNNMQVISSLLSLQAGRSEDASVLHALRESTNRVRSMALVHEMLYRSPNLARVTGARYLRTLVESLLQSAENPLVRAEVLGDDVTLSAEQAIPIGLIANELVTNALKHAFPRGSGGAITVIIKKAVNGKVELSVRDDGRGLPPGLDVRTTDTLGLQLVANLTDQLEGEMTVRGEGGTTVTVLFRPG